MSDPYEDVIVTRAIDKDLELIVMPLTFGRARINSRAPASQYYDDGW